MRDLNSNIQNILKQYFFRNENFSNWEKVSNDLLDTGKSIVIETSPIWIGGIGNFIKIIHQEDNSFKYTFNIKDFLRSKLWIEWKEVFINDIREEIQDLKQTKKDIENLT